MSRLRPSSTGHRPDGTLPLINIVLLLVLAFMMAGTITEPLPAGFDPLRADAEALPPAPSEPLLVFVDAQGQILVSGQAQSETEIEQKLQALKQSAGRVEVRADAAAPAGRIFFLLTAAEKAALSDLKIVTLGRTR